MDKFVLPAVLGLFLLVTVFPSGAQGGSGAKTYGDQCNFAISTVQLFSDDNLADACDKNKGLFFALNKCACLPGYRWDQNFVENIFGVGGACVSGASSILAMTKTLGLVLASVTILANLF